MFNSEAGVEDDDGFMCSGIHRNYIVLAGGGIIIAAAALM